ARAGEPYRDNKDRLVCKIAVEPAPDCPEGRHEEAVVLYTSDPEYRDLTVPVTIVKRSRQRLSAAPREVTLTAAPGQPLPARIVQLRDPRDQPVLIETVTADDPAITCRWAPGPGNAATLRIRVDHAASEQRPGHLAAAHDADVLAGLPLRPADELGGVPPHEGDAPAGVLWERPREDVVLHPRIAAPVAAPEGDLVRLPPHQDGV